MSLALTMYVQTYISELLPNLALLRSEKLVIFVLTVVPRTHTKWMYLCYYVNIYILIFLLFTKWSFNKYVQ